MNADSILGADIDIVKYNLFRYCGNNPVNYVDPQGHSIGLAVLLVGAIAGIVLIAIGFISIPLPNPSGTGWADIPTFSSIILQKACFGIMPKQAEMKEIFLFHLFYI